MNVPLNKDRLTLLGSAGLGLVLGAGVMYLLDPQGGRRRRALARDKAVSLAKTGGTVVGKKSRHLGNRTKGLISEAGSGLRRSATGLLRRGKNDGNGSGLAELHSESSQSGELASHGDSLHHNDLLPHGQVAGGSSSVQEDPFQPL
jgi:hypothetical protein